MITETNSNAPMSMHECFSLFKAEAKKQTDIIAAAKAKRDAAIKAANDEFNSVKSNAKAAAKREYAKFKTTQQKFQTERAAKRAELKMKLAQKKAAAKAKAEAKAEAKKTAAKKLAKKPTKKVANEVAVGAK